MPLNFSNPITLKEIDLSKEASEKRQLDAPYGSKKYASVQKEFIFPEFSNIWNVYKNNNPIFDIDTCTEVDYEFKTKISTYPIENGSFTSYNKVQEPRIIKIKLAVGGSQRIQTLIRQLETITTSVDIYDVLVPENTYQNFNIQSVHYTRTSDQGKNLLIVTLDMMEVRQINTLHGYLVTVKVAQATSKENDGNQQPETKYQLYQMENMTPAERDAAVKKEAHDAQYNKFKTSQEWNKTPIFK
jgi:hypothetical protein